jgi:hypothetical protein
MDYKKRARLWEIMETLAEVNELLITSSVKDKSMSLPQSQRTRHMVVGLKDEVHEILFPVQNIEGKPYK